MSKYDETALASLENASSMTIKHRLMPLLHAFVQNSKRIHELGAATIIGKPLYGRPAFIIGAGPSLDKNIHLLNDAKRKGAIFAVNTSLPALKQHEIRPHVLTSVEAIDVTSHMDPEFCDVMAVDLQSHPNVFDAAVDKASQAYWFTNPGMHLLHVLRFLGVPPVYYRTSVTVAATELAMLWGCNPIVFVGMDLSYDIGRGKAYAAGAAWDGYEVEENEQGLKFSGREDRDRMHHASGAPAAPRQRERITLPGWGESDDVATTVEMFAQYKYFSDYAPFARQTLVNCTEGGCSIEGIQDVPLKAVLKSLDTNYKKIEWPDVRMPEQVVESLMIGFEEQGKCADTIAEIFLDDRPMKGDDLVTMGSGAVNYPTAMSQGDFMGISDDTEMKIKAKMTAKYEVFRAAGATLRSWVGGDKEPEILKPTVKPKEIQVDVEASTDH